MSTSLLGTDAPAPATRPWANWALALANLAAFVAQAVDPSLAPRYWLDGRDSRLHQFVTYAFLHVSVLHLGCNLILLLALGRDVNARLGQVGYAAFYLAAAVFSGVGFMLVSDQAVVGASGAVGAVMSAFLVLLPRARLVLDVRVGHFEVRAIYAVIVFFAYNVLMSALTSPAYHAVAYEAHVAGMVFGAVVVLALQLVGLLPRAPDDLLSVARQWNRRRVYRRLVKNGYDPFTLPPVVPVGGSGGGGATAVADDGGGAGLAGGGAATLDAGGGDAATARDPEARALRATLLRAEVAQAVADRDLPRAAELFVRLKRLDPNQVLPRQAQHDVATQLASEQRFVEAADAYEQFLERYPTFEQVEQVQLMLGLIYARYLERYARAKECLLAALERLQTDREVEMARAELARIEQLLPPSRF